MHICLYIIYIHIHMYTYLDIRRFWVRQRSYSMHSKMAISCQESKVTKAEKSKAGPLLSSRAP